MVDRHHLDAVRLRIALTFLLSEICVQETDRYRISECGIFSQGADGLVFY